MEMLFTAVLILLLLTTNLFFVKSSGIRLHKRYTEVNVCQNTTSSLVKVKKCPDEPIFSDKAKKKMCNNYPPCQGEELVFHCVRYEDGFAEVCAPKETITGYCCALFDEALGRVREDMSTNCSKCPFHYDSTESKTYVECYHIGNEKVHNGSGSNEFLFALVIAVVIVSLVVVFLLFMIRRYKKCLFSKKNTTSEPEHRIIAVNKECSSKLLDNERMKPLC